MRLAPTAYRFAKGHRLRIQVSGGAFPRFARNLGTGEPHATATVGHATRLEILHDDAHPSVVTIPAR
ncbi:CocE/NonD family hydrolase C-terminal non-catalytic domain-containing protein [Escherichia coli]